MSCRGNAVLGTSWKHLFIFPCSFDLRDRSFLSEKSELPEERPQRWPLAAIFCFYPRMERRSASADDLWSCSVSRDRFGLWELAQQLCKLTVLMFKERRTSKLRQAKGGRYCLSFTVHPETTQGILSNAWFRYRCCHCSHSTKMS